MIISAQVSRINNQGDKGDEREAALSKLLEKVSKNSIHVVRHFLKFCVLVMVYH